MIEKVVNSFIQYQIEWLTGHCDIELEPELETLIIRFLKDTGECFLREQEDEMSKRHIEEIEPGKVFGYLSKGIPVYRFCEDECELVDLGYEKAGDIFAKIDDSGLRDSYNYFVMSGRKLEVDHEFHG